MYTRATVDTSTKLQMGTLDVRSKFPAAVQRHTVSNADISQRQLWRVTRFVLSESHLAAAHKDSRLWNERAEPEPCSGLHARCALGRDTIAQHAVIYHVYVQQLRELTV